MKKDKRIMIITICLMSVILACVMFMQFKVVNESNIEQIESMREDELEQAISNWKEKYEKAFKQLEETNEKISEYQDKVQDNEEIKELVEKELSEAQKNFGLTDITGEGVIITLIDNQEKTYKAEDLLDLVNELKASGSEAISINDIRVTNITDIVYILERYIRVDGNNSSSPYIIN